MKLLIDIPDEMWSDLNANPRIIDICLKYPVLKMYRDATPLTENLTNEEVFTTVFSETRKAVQMLIECRVLNRPLTLSSQWLQKKYRG